MTTQGLDHWAARQSELWCAHCGRWHLEDPCLHDCPRCDGTGVIETPVCGRFAEHPYREDTCPTCAGQGVV